MKMADCEFDNLWEEREYKSKFQASRSLRSRVSLREEVIRSEHSAFALLNGVSQSRIGHPVKYLA
jgi:hypothetical protein